MQEPHPPEVSANTGIAEIPSKYDIIPIHTSDVSQFLNCRRKWDWSSPTRTNLRHRVEFYGVNVNLWFGSGIHYALEMYYNPALQRDPVEAFKTWWQYQWHGGIVSEEWLERTYDIKPERTEIVLSAPNAEGQMDDASEPIEAWKIRGLKDLLPMPDQAEYEAFLELGVGMMEFYKTWAPKHDKNIEIIAAESQFSVPLFLPGTTDPLKFVDLREESPNYGNLIEVHARGKRDAIRLDHSNGQYGIIDYKTASKIDEDYFKKLENDPQVSNYMWSTQIEAIIGNYPWKKISFCDYQAMWKKVLKPPTPLRDGIFPSISRSDESCTAEMFAEYVANMGIQSWFDSNDKAKAYYEYLVTEGDDRFINRHRVYRSQQELITTGNELSMIAMDMLDENLRIYKKPSGDRNCTRCAFRAPCLAKDDGSDWQEMLSQGYEPNKGR